MNLRIAKAVSRIIRITVIVAFILTAASIISTTVGQLRLEKELENLGMDVTGLKLDKFIEVMRKYLDTGDEKYKEDAGAIFNSEVILWIVNTKGIRTIFILAVLFLTGILAYIFLPGIVTLIVALPVALLMKRPKTILLLRKFRTPDKIKKNN